MNKITLEKNEEGKLVITGIPNNMIFEDGDKSCIPILLKTLLDIHKDYIELFNVFEHTATSRTVFISNVQSGMKWMIENYDPLREKCNQNAELLRKILDVWMSKHPPTPMTLQLQAAAPITFLENIINDVCKELS